MLGVKNQHITEATKGYEADGHTGTWYAVGMKTYHGERFFQMRSEEYGQEVADLIVSENGTLVAEDIWHGFDEGAREAISEYLEENGATVYDLMNIPDQATVILADGTVMKNNGTADDQYRYMGTDTDRTESARGKNRNLVSSRYIKSEKKWH